MQATPITPKLPFAVHPSFANLADFKRPVLGVERRVIQAVLDQYRGQAVIDVPGDIAHILSAVAYNLQVLERDQAEQDPNYVHLVTYSPIFNADTFSRPDLTLHTYQRTKGIGEERLMLMRSLGVGGHAEPDAALFSRIQEALIAGEHEQIGEHFDPMTVIHSMFVQHIQANVLLREFTEEIAQLQWLGEYEQLCQQAWFAHHDVDQAHLQQLEALIARHPFAASVLNTVGQLFTTIPDLLLFDESNDVGRVHLGVVTFVPFVGDGATSDVIEMGEASLINPSWQPVDAILDASVYESWSVQIAQWLLRPIDAQLEQFWDERMEQRVQAGREVARNLKIGTNDPASGLNANIDFTPGVN